MAKQMKEENEIVEAIMSAASLLGTGNAATSMGALEYVGSAIEISGKDIGNALRDIATAINRLAVAYEDRTEEESAREPYPTK